jgi:hypothetical protein
MSYNGWKNYETWAVKLWLDNEEGSYYAMRELAEEYRHEDAWKLGDAIKDWHEEFMPDLGASLWSDLLTSAFEEVDWREIAEAYIEDLDPEEEEEEDA